MTSHVTYKPEKSNQSWDAGVAGAASGFSTRLLTQPFDVVKIRLQLQVEATVGANKGLYHGIAQSLHTIKKHEGFSSLWKGHVASQMLVVTYVSTQFYAYTFFSKVCHSYNIKNGTQQALCGGIAGACGTILSMPFDIARTRIIAQSKKEYRGVTDVWKQLVGKEGFFSLWRGLTPTMCMIVPSAAIQFRCYGYIVNALSNTADEFIGLSISAIAGAVAGLVSKFCVYPLDVFKKRIQIMGSENIRDQFGKVELYKNPLHCAVTICRTEGVLGWYKGVTPSLLKAVVTSSLIFIFFEFYCDLLRKRANRR